MKWMLHPVDPETGREYDECPRDHHAFNMAAKYGHLELMKWMLNPVDDYGQVHDGFSWTDWVFAEAAAYGSLENLKWLKEHGCPWDSWTFREAVQLASDHNLEILKWLRDPIDDKEVPYPDRCPWDTWVFCDAVEHGNFEIIKWLTIESCPWDENVFVKAVQVGDLEIIQWLRNPIWIGDEDGVERRRQPCPMKWSSAFQVAHQQKNAEVLRWLVEESIKEF